MNGKKYESIHFADAAFKYYNEAGYNGNPWAEAIQFRSAYVKQNENPRKGDVRVTYHIGMDSAPDLSAPMRLVVERPDLWTVRLNGKEISPVPGEWWFDRAFGVFDLIAEDSGTAGRLSSFHYSSESTGKSRSIEYIVTQYQACTIISDEIFSKYKCLCKSVRGRLLFVTEFYAELCSVSQQLLKIR